VSVRQSKRAPGRTLTERRDLPDRGAGQGRR